MYMICYTFPNTNQNTWLIIDGEDAMNCFVGDLVDKMGLDPQKDIMVFEMEDEIDNKYKKADTPVVQ